jgi:hypothetical protein
MADATDKQITKWNDDEVLELLTPDMQKATNIQNELSNQRADCYKLFRSALYGNERTGFSQTVAPVVFNNHSWTMANLMDIFNDDFFVLKGEDEDRSSKFQKLINYQLFRKQDGFIKFYDLLFTANLYHYCVSKVCYEEDFDLESDTYARLSADEMMQLAQDPAVTVTKYDEVTDETGATAYEKVKVVRKKVNYAGPMLHVIPTTDFFYSADCKVTDWGAIKGRLVYQNATKTLNDVRKKEKAGIYKKGTFEKLKEKGDTKTPDATDKVEYIFNADSISETSTQEPSNDETNILSREVEIKECYFQLDIDGDGLLEPVIIDICDDVVCRLVENPYGRPPFRIGRVKPEPHKVQGLATPLLLDNDQKIATNLTRLIQDSAALDCYKNPVTNDAQMFAMLQDRKPFAVIKGDPTRLGEVKTSPPSAFVLQAMDRFESSLETKTGISKYNTGQDASSLNKTATGISAIFAASTKPMRLLARILGNGIIQGIIRDFIFINQKWKPETDVRILGTDVTVNPEDLDGAYEIEIDIGVSDAEKNERANQIDLHIQFMTQAGLQMGLGTPAHVQQAILAKYRLQGLKANGWMFTPKEIQENQQKAQAQPKQPDPAQQQAQMQMQMEQQRLQMDQQRAQMDMQGKQAEMQMAGAETQQKIQQEQALFNQKIRHNEELHDQKMRQEAERAKQQDKQAKARPAQAVA